MKLDHMQALLDDFCIPLQLASGSTQEQDPATAGDKVRTTLLHTTQNQNTTLPVHMEGHMTMAVLCAIRCIYSLCL